MPTLKTRGLFPSLHVVPSDSSEYHRLERLLKEAKQ